MSDRRPSPFKTLLESEVCTLILAAPDVYQVRFKNRAANAYLVVGSRRTIMIDVGLSSNYPHLLACLKHLGITPDSIDMPAKRRNPLRGPPRIIRAKAKPRPGSHGVIGRPLWT